MKFLWGGKYCKKLGFLAILNGNIFSIYMKYFNVFNKMYVMYLSIGKSFCKGCDDFSCVEDQKSYRISIHTHNSTPFHPTEFL